MFYNPRAYAFDKQPGYTLIELLLVLTIIGVILTASLASWHTTQLAYIKRNVLRDITHALYMARSEAILNAETFIFSPINASSDWSSGMMLHQATNASVTQATARQVWHWPDKRLHLSWHGFQGDKQIVVSHVPHRLALNGYFLVNIKGFPTERWVVNRFGRIRVLRKHVD